jgi:hypothetical protein
LQPAHQRQTRQQRVIYSHPSDARCQPVEQPVGAADIAEHHRRTGKSVLPVSQKKFERRRFDGNDGVEMDALVVLAEEVSRQVGRRIFRNEVPVEILAEISTPGNNLVSVSRKTLSCCEENGRRTLSD